jgi:hypothetical protein
VFDVWIVNGGPRPPGQATLRVTMDGHRTVVARYRYGQRLDGDVNWDCKVNVLDLIYVRNRLGGECSE